MTGLLTLLAFLALQETSVPVTIETKDGNILSGTVEDRPLTLVAGLGKVPLNLRDVMTIKVESGGVTVSANGGTTLKGTLSQDHWKIKTTLGEFTVKLTDIVQIVILRTPGASGRPPDRSPATGASPVAPLSPGQVPPIKADRKLDLPQVPHRTVRSQDGKQIYLLNAETSRLCTVDLEAFQKGKEIAVGEGASLLSLAADNSVLVAASRNELSVVSLSDWKLESKFVIEYPLHDICAINAKTLVGSTMHNEILEISIPKQAVTKVIGGGNSENLLLSRDGRRIYTTTGMVQLQIGQDGRRDLLEGTTLPIGAGGMLPSPDLRFAVGVRGGVVRLGTSSFGGVAPVAQLEPNRGAAWAPAAQKLFLFTVKDRVREYDTDTWELKKEWPLGWMMDAAYSDDTGTVLTVYGGPTSFVAIHPPNLNGKDLVQFKVPP